MRKILARIHSGSRGFTMVETVVAAGIAITVLSFAGSEIRRSMELKKLVQNQDVITELETKIRMAVKDPNSLNRSAEKEDSLKECITADNKDCSVIVKRSKSGSAAAGKSFPLSFVNGSGAGEMVTLLTGSFDGMGRPCTAGCPISVKTSFYGVCYKDKAKCDMAQTIVVNYSIEVDGKPFRNGVANVTFAVGDSPDDNLPCGLDASQNPRFAQSVSYGAVDCVDLPIPVRKLTGVNPGTCVMGKEVMVGFDPGTRNIICVPAKFTEGK